MLATLLATRKVESKISRIERPPMKGLGGENEGENEGHALDREVYRFTT